MDSIRIRYQTLEFEGVDIHVRSLRDRQEFSDPFGEAAALGISSAQWSLFGVIWESSEVLARKMSSFDIQGKRILEVGCGMALSSLLLKQRDADITATDYHPEAGGFLAENVKLNSGQKIPFVRTDWGDLDDGLGEFDLIIGADLLYEEQHIELLSEFINRHAKAQCEVVLVDPDRRQLGAFSRKMLTLGYSCGKLEPEEMDPPRQVFKGSILQYLRE
jgi:predicted nicotinamide N-methyase